jgi:hypothetical protein
MVHRNLTLAVSCSKRNAKITREHCTMGLSALELFVQEVAGSGELLMVSARLAANRYLGRDPSSGAPRGHPIRLNLPRQQPSLDSE